MFAVEIVVLLIIITADLTSKAYITGLLEVENGVAGRIVPIIENILEFRYSENTGAGWSLMTGKTGLLIALTSVCTVALIIFLALNKKENRFFRMSLVFILGGGVGNLIDRIFLGYVRDFIYFKPINFPIFNVADSFVTVGAVLMVVFVLFMSSKDFQERQDNNASSGNANRKGDSDDSRRIKEYNTDGEDASE